MILEVGNIALYLQILGYKSVLGLNLFIVLSMIWVRKSNGWTNESEKCSTVIQRRFPICRTAQIDNDTYILKWNKFAILLAFSCVGR